MHHFYAGLLALACFGAQAGTYELSLTNASFDVVDLTPVDQFMPGYTANAGGLLSLITPVDYHDKGSAFEENTVFPQNTGPNEGFMTGTITPGTELRWTFTMHQKISVLDTDNAWDYDSVKVRTTFYGVCDIPFAIDNPTGLYGTGGTYQRLAQEQDFTITIYASNPYDQPRQYQIGWFHQYQFDSYSIDRPITAVPEPETYAMLLAGLGIVGAAVRRRGSYS